MIHRSCILIILNTYSTIISEMAIKFFDTFRRKVEKSMKAKKLLITCAFICSTIASVSFGALAYSGSIDYDTDQKVKLKSCYNSSNTTAVTLTANTRPDIGIGGAKVSVERTNGVVDAAKTFPYYVSVSNLTSSIPARSTRYVYIAPVTEEQRIVGGLTLNY